MRRLIVFVIVALLLGSVGSNIPVHQTQAQIAPTIVLSPDSGFAAITIVGSGFSQSVERKLPIYIVWDGARIPTIPASPIYTSSFTVIISVPTQTAPGWHVVTALSDYEKASADFYVTDMQGAQGPAGPQGPEGPPGYGYEGPAGPPGPSCWDLNGNNIPDASEDTNKDGAVNVLDCQGPAGINCWDLDADGIQDASEDTNKDGKVDVLDCKGAPGEGGTGGGAAGAPGAPGINCWDLNANGIKDKDEDANKDGTVDVLDCRGALGPEGEQGPAGGGMIWQGDWSEDTEYAIGDAVAYDGSAYIAIASSANENPSESSEAWQLFAAAGERGDTGEAGTAGKAGTAGFFLALLALILIIVGKVKKWIMP